MTTSSLEKLSKVLALADSGHDGEAMAALRAARSMLRTDGVNLSEVLKTALQERRNEHVQVRGGVVNSLQREVVQLQIKLAAVQRDLREQQQEAQHWRKQAEENARKLKAESAEKIHYKVQSKTVAEKLMELAKALENDEKALVK